MKTTAYSLNNFWQPEIFWARRKVEYFQKTRSWFAVFSGVH